MELGNHAEFLGVSSYAEMLATYFINDVCETAQWRLKKHGVEKFWQWIGSWAVFLNNPRDLGYDGTRFDLPPLNVHHHLLPVSTDSAHAVGKLFLEKVEGLQQRRDIRHESINDRLEKAVSLLDDEQWLIWCDYNDEAEALVKAIPDAIEVRGDHSIDEKVERLLGFATGKYRILVTKPKIASQGMNWQLCHKMIFFGLSDSMKNYYQSVRRCWRFGQNHPVDVHVIATEAETNIIANVARKQADLERMSQAVIDQTRDKSIENIRGATKRDTLAYAPTQAMIWQF
jgi:hypothetical protein